MYEMAGTKAPVRMWVDPQTVEHAALNQIRNVGNLPWVHGMAVMPDCHFGKGATVGSVIAMRDAVSPATVGVDIGCGMCAVPVQMHQDALPDDLGPLRRAIEDVVPLGMSSHSTASSEFNKRTALSGEKGWGEFLRGYSDLTVSLSTNRLNTEDYRERVFSQIGTLGGGNHFIEVCVDETGYVWLMLHSGSRNLGKEVAERHIAAAKALPHNQDLPDKDLAVFLKGSPGMDAYLRDLRWAQEYARRNRAMMMGQVKAAFGRVTGLGSSMLFGDMIQCHHNYVSEETYDGLELIITRKGAISTSDDRLGIIPGSMGTGSYIVRGLGNPASFNSASHGAGRKMSRSAAKRTFTVADLQAQTEGVECRKDDGVLDEIPGSYKSLEDVMAQQTSLVAPVARLKTLVCVKG